MTAYRFYTGLFLVTACTLMLQLLQTRILSVLAWYHLAFFAISMAMFGISAGAVWVYLRGDRFSSKTLQQDLAHYTTLFAVSIFICLIVQMTLVPVTVKSLVWVIVWLEIAITIAIPFFFSGVVVSLALTRSEFPISRVYGVDLAGAGVGCVLVLLLLEASDAPTAIMWVGVLAMLASVTFSGTEAPGSGRKATLLGVMTLVSVLNGLGPYGLQPLAVKGSFEGGSSHIFREWNSFSRVAVFPEIEALPAMWGPSWRMPENTKPMLQRCLQIDGDAGTMAYRFSGDLNEFQFLRSDVTNIAYFLPGREKTAVIGVGGGRDVLSAAVFGATDITAVEVNPIFIRLLTVEEGFADFTNIDRISGLKLVVDEGRSWFARTDESFDLIQMSLVDTWAATGAGAFTLSENGLYTVEAWQTFVSRLAPDGVFTVSRWFNPETVNETGRLISLGAATLISLGVESPADHLLLISQGNVTTLVLSRSPFDREGLEVLHQAANFLEHRVLLSPLQESVSRDLQKIVSAGSLDALELVTADYTYDLSPPTDDRPFFFNQLRFDRPVEAIRISASLMGLDTIGGGIREGNVIATVTLIVLFMVSLLLVLATVVLPLRGAIANAGKPLVVAGTVYFLLIGMGFMLIEIGLLQRTSVFLGHPIYSLGVLLSSLIIATGLGSLLSGRFSLVSRKAFLSWSLLTSGYLLLVAFLLPDLLEANRTASQPVKTLISVAIIAPAGILMGFAFPTGMALVSAVDERPTPWFWGINGAAGVLAICDGYRHQHGRGHQHDPDGRRLLLPPASALLPATAETRMTYRPEIDGVRAIAVLAVMLYHANIDDLNATMGGGYLGVDVFS